ncbi:DUF7269 family protein [Haloarchaeobius amylolyticus]|uniref:DUF7269 family protein n=1 Tax=Haloarchaeobius amylolyticus TaxID=1198296 RepID=UPI002270A1AC|nr:hypothetical protein [Haloarchaeobius amylolyticus]
MSGRGPVRKLSNASGRAFGRIFDRRLVLLLVGVGAFLGALVLAFLPYPMEPTRPYVEGILTSRGTVLFLGMAGGIIGALHLYRTEREEPRAVLDGAFPESARYQARESAGESFDSSVETLTGELPDSKSRTWWQSRERLEVEKQVRAVALDVLQRSENWSREEAEAHLERGTWTDDPRAASYLGGEAAPDLPLKMQFYDWLSGEAFERHVTHTVDEIAERAELTEVER